MHGSPHLFGDVMTQTVVAVGPGATFKEIVKAGSVTAEELMPAPAAVTVHADATLIRAARTVAQHRVDWLPVVAGTGGLRGVVGRSDLLKVFLQPDEEPAEEIRRHVVPLVCPSLAPVAARLVRAVEGVDDVRCHLTGPGLRGEAT
ncbi:CBS domain-containing protein [Streptomyces sp. ActVer]|uniref:CBS domain-containing protein n=1 Tax=Streptomyces sp. ActVer TaxID=3014558 RepID=UPI0022B43611|nr:CBS domain-containing protein [Streptomyces sp. ActVer]MCZ4514712.1 CBS domain-containing protein [Streptomyces sp. ActVer]